MHTATTQRPAKARSKQPVYPDVGTDHPAFFLSCFLREQARYEALWPATMGFSFYRKPLAFQDAIFFSLARIRQDADASLKYVIRDGLLPFAHAHTTYFDQQVAA